MNLHLVSCPICEGRESQTVYFKFGLPISRCIHCGLVFANPRIATEEILKRYCNRYFYTEYLPSLGVVNGEYNLELFDQRYAPMLDFIRERAGIPGRLLEIGAGAGFFLKAAQRSGWQVVGVEASEEGAHFARKELDLPVQQQLAEEMALGEDSFHVVVMFDVIEHLLDPGLVLRTARRSLLPGGLIVISTPNLNALSRIFLGTPWAVLSPAEHLYYFTETTLIRIMERAGFTQIRIQRRFPGSTTFQTMNSRYTHGPHGVRARVYSFLVDRLGPRVFRVVQSRGWGDSLLCSATAPA